MGGQPTLKRSISLPAMIFYGVGTMVGGGIYALLGKVAGLAGYHTPVALILAGVLALVTAASFAELASRFPFSAGAAAYVKEGFSSTRLSIAVGLLVIATGVVSTATLSVAAVGFMQSLANVPELLAVVLLVLGLGSLAAWGVNQSVAVVTLITIVEVGALIYVALAAGVSPGEIAVRWSDLVPATDAETWVGIISGTFLAFYAFLGFEDMVNMAEEVKRVRRTLPIAIFASVIATLVLYLVVSLAAVLAVPPEELAASRAPLARIIEGGGRYISTGLVVVSLLAGLNGALVQILMAARVAYGMAARGEGPAWFNAVGARTRTPVRATATVTAAVLVLALNAPLVALAKTTSAIILAVFALVNLALWRVIGANPDRHGDGPRLPRWLPLAGFVSCAAILLFQLRLLLQ